MQLTVRMCDADREALSVPASMPVEVGRLRVQENRQLRAAGWHTVEAWVKALQAEDIEAVCFLVWLACRRHGYRGSFADIDFELTETHIDAPTDGGQPGEAEPAAAGDSTKS